MVGVWMVGASGVSKGKGVAVDGRVAVMTCDSTVAVFSLCTVILHADRYKAAKISNDLLIFIGTK